MNILIDRNELLNKFNHALQELINNKIIKEMVNNKKDISINLDRFNIIHYEKLNDKHPKCNYFLRLHLKEELLKYEIKVFYYGEGILSDETLIANNFVNERVSEHINLLNATLLFFGNKENYDNIEKMITETI